MTKKRYEELKKLIDRKIITKGTIVTVKTQMKIFGGGYSVKSRDFIVKNIKEVNGNIFYIVEDLEEKGKQYIVNYKNVYKYDGILVDRFIASYKDTDNSVKVEKIDPITGLPVKRGRKPKWYKELLEKMKNQSNVQ